MKTKIELTVAELGLVTSALEKNIFILRNRFGEDPKYIHPAKKYEDLYDKLTEWSDPHPSDTVYSLTDKLQKQMTPCTCHLPISHIEKTIMESMHKKPTVFEPSIPREFAKD